MTRQSYGGACTNSSLISVIFKRLTKNRTVVSGRDTVYAVNHMYKYFENVYN